MFSQNSYLVKLSASALSKEKRLVKLTLLKKNFNFSLLFLKLYFLSWIDKVRGRC
ncbi:hypothetical protein PVOR_15129 [Paenibacillus vortex V453]|uniref:Uncharacterized protein n=1 Tax=Paenibacillus vortex V453 TaxID=715225 RepID=A0A2R9SV87_9BACL|nr:hypothetical protein PVOR_15129 [Paenibacillus vortex V453]